MPAGQVQTRTYDAAGIRRTSSEICCPTSGRRHGQRPPPDRAPRAALFLREIGGASSTTASWHPAWDGFAGRIPFIRSILQFGFQAHLALESKPHFKLIPYWNRTHRSGSSRIGQF